MNKTLVARVQTHSRGYGVYRGLLERTGQIPDSNFCTTVLYLERTGQILRYFDPRMLGVNTESIVYVIVVSANRG